MISLFEYQAHRSPAGEDPPQFAQLPRLRVGLPCLLLMSSLAFASAQPLPVAIPLDGESFSAELAGFDSQQNLKLKIGDKLRIVPAADLLRYGSWNDIETGPQIVLASGGVIRADVLSLTPENWIIGDASDLGSVLWSESNLPLEAVCGVLWQPPADPLARDRLRFKLLSLPAGDDQLLLAGGETLSGTLVSVPPAGRFTENMTKAELAASDVFQLQLPKADKPLSIAANKVVAIRCGAGDPTRAQNTQAFARVGFREGTCILAAKIETAQGAFTLHLPGGGKLVANKAFSDGTTDWFWKQISLLEPQSDRFAYVSDLEPLGYKHLPFLSGEWQFGRDQNVLGGALRTKDQLFAKGLAMFPASRLAYTLDGKYRRLQGQLALDAHAGRKGSVVCRVLTADDTGSWTNIYESPILRGGEDPVAISLEVKSAQRLAILVDFADRGDQCDYANWLDLRLIK
jgi:hypothetical protein